MIKKYSLVFIALLCSFFYGFGQVTDLIISEYGEGTPGNAKYIEIYNGTGATINLSNYQLWKITNGGPWNEGTYNFVTATLADGATLVIANNSTNTSGADEYAPGFCSWNGDDAIGLAKSGILIDAVGTNGADPGTGWSVAGTNNATVDHTLTRKSTVCSPNTNWSTSAGTNATDSEWVLTTYGNGAANTGHTSSCSSTSDLSISGTPTDHGSTCINTAATTVQYTITNNGAFQALNIVVASNDAQFAISNLSSTTIAPAGTGTYDVTFTPTTVGVKNATITVSSSTTTDATNSLTGTGITVSIITTQPTNQAVEIPNTAIFSIVTTGATSYQWEINTGSGWNNVSTGTGATTDSYTSGATSAPMNTNQYRCVVTNSCGFVNSNAAILTLTNSATSNVTGIEGCFEDNSVILNWTPPGTGTPTGYIVFALDGGTDPTGAKTDANTYTANSDFSAATPVTPASLGRVVYKGTATTATITGLTEDNNYSFTTYAYVGEALTGWSGGGTNGSTVTNETAQGDVRNLAATPLTNQVNLNWNNPLPTSCFDQLIIVANTGTIVFTPTGTYANTDVNYTTPNAIMYSTTSTVSAKALSGLTNGTNYCFKVFIRRGSTWSDGVEVCAVPSLTYCSSDGDGTDGFFTLINNVEFNTINNASPVTTDNAYSDFTSVSTTVTLGETYNLDVRVETDGAFTTTARAWIDWNNDGDFGDSNEQYELGNAFNAIDGSTDGSPLAIEVPTNSVIAATRMRISNRYGTAASTSCQTGFDGEVEDYTINIIQPVNAEINIKGNNISIANGFNAPYGLNNTLFGSTNVGSAGPIKNFFVENIGATTLNLTGTPIVQIIGAHPGDFIVNQQAAVSITSASNSEFIIQFFPSADGQRTATIRIENTDSDEDSYEFDIEGTAVCSAVLTSSIWPIEGPENTEVTITSATDLTGATAELNGLTMPIISSSAGELVVTVPPIATDGNLIVVFSTGCSSTNSFDVLDTAIAGCDNASSNTLGDLFISEVTDATSGSSSLVEIYNGTPNAVNLSDYSVNIYNNGSASPSSVNSLTGTLASGGVYVVSIGTTSCTLNNISVSANQSFSSSSGINFDNNSSDMIALYKTSTTSIIDAYGVFGSNSWSNSLGLGLDGVNFRRKNTATPLPSAMFNLADWDIIDWTSCGDSDYVNIGQFDFSLGVPPAVTLQPIANNTNCDSSIDLVVEGSEGLSDGLSLAYRWFYLVLGNSSWTEITSDGGPYTGFDQATLTLSFSDVIDVNGYQYYCQVRENSATCYTASNAVKLNHERAFWDSNTWSSSPDINKLVVINDDYNTNAQTSFEACNLIVNAGSTLTVANTYYVEVENNAVVKGNLNVQSQGSFIQNDNAGTFTHSGTGTSQVTKLTAPLATLYTYTYWSSPVKDALIGTALFTTNPNRRYYFEASNFLDEHTDETTNGIPDDIDDNGDDWQLAVATNIMEVGRGYASTHTNIGFVSGNSYGYIFPGEFNTGTILEPLSNNPANTANHWNLVGNPYPSAIRVRGANSLFSENTGIINYEVYMWSQYRAPLGTNPGNEGLNFSQDDYITINNTGPVGNGSDLDGDGNVDVPDENIPSGQSFFVSSLPPASNLTFTNSMRISGDDANDQFFGSNDSTQETNNVTYSNERLWLNLVSDNGAANQLLVGYINGASDNIDSGYDTKRNLTANSSTIIYTGINDISNEKFVIQAKDINSINKDEFIPVGFKTNINVPTIFTFSLIKYEGSFLESNTVYLKDKLLNKTHNLKTSDYSFTSEVGEFNDRFEIVFTEDALSLGEVKIDNNTLQIIELQNGDVQFKVSSQFEMKSIEIVDLLGRTLYKLDAQGNSQTFSLSNLSQATYIAKVELTNGYVITKKALKRN